MKPLAKLVLIDGHALVHRAFHALPPLTNPSGVPTNAIFGFCSVLIKMIKDLKPDYVVATFDLAGPTFRHEEFAEYKSHRVKAPDELHAQVPYIKEIMTAFGIPIFEKPGFEADDLIGALSEKGKVHDGLQVVIMTGDLDTLQLVDGDKVVVFTMRKGMTDTVIYNEKEVRARYGLEPSQVIDFKGLKGDPSDNIPGVPGVGDVTASALIKEFGSLEGLYEYLENKKKKFKKPLTEKLAEKLLANKDQAFFSKKLATIIRDVDIDFALEDARWREHMDRPKLEKLLKELALFSIVKRITELDAPEAPPAAAPASLFDTTAAVSADAELLSSTEQALEHLEKLSAKQEVVIDMVNEVVVMGDSASTFGFPEVLLKGKVLVAFRKLLEDKGIAKVARDSKMLTRWALREGIEPAGIVFDVKLAAFVCNSDIKDYALERLYFMEFGKDMAPRALARVGAIQELKQKYEEKLSVGKLKSVLDDIELPVAPVLAHMEHKGILIDPVVAEKLKKLVTKELAVLEKEIYSHATKEFNINSPQQLSGILFDTLNLKGKVKKTGKGALSTAAGELDKLIDEHPIIVQILKYRELQKLKTTYIEPLPLLIDPKTHRIHTTYNQTGATTGRLSSQDPNLQNIPIRTELGQEFRKVFVASKGTKLVSCDYSQLELRIAAHISGDLAMSEAFKKGEDIHTRTASRVLGVDPSAVTPTMRRQAKTLNFGVLYGMGIMGFQRAAGVSRDQARQFIDNYKKEFIGLTAYMEKTITDARKNGYVETIFGRRRLMPDILSTMPAVRAGAERMATNMPIQGTEADLLKIAMIHIHELIETKYRDDAAMLLNVHDELLFEIKEDKVAEITPQIITIMENVYKFDVPIIADAKVGDNWSEMQEI